MDYNGNRTRIQRGNYHRMANNCPCEKQNVINSVNNCSSQNCNCNGNASVSNCNRAAMNTNNVNTTDSVGCACADRTISVECNIPRRPVGISYVTVQTFGDIYPPQKALNVGTVFESLDYPFTAACCSSNQMRGGRV